MAQLPRPANTIDNSADLKVGDTIFRVYGNYPPQMGDESKIVGPAIPFKDHPEYDPIHVQLADHIVFDVQRSGYVTYEYSDDNNMNGYSHNDNYCFRTREDAEAAVEFLKSQWEANPDLIAAHMITSNLLESLIDDCLDHDDYWYPNDDRDYA